MRQHGTGERGYSLAEALVVVAIIGIITIVSVPNFIAMYRSSKVKGAVLKFTNDLRAARQRAATTYRPVMVSVGTTTAERGSYWISSWDGSAWVGATKKDLEPGVTDDLKTTFFRFPVADSYQDTVGSDSRRDIIFENNGGIRNTPANPLPADPTLYIYTGLNLPKASFTITVNAGGTVEVQ